MILTIPYSHYYWVGGPPNILHLKTCPEENGRGGLKSCIPMKE